MAESPVSLAASLVDSFTVQFAESYPGAFGGFLPQRYISDLTSVETYGGYHHIPPAFRAASVAIELKAGLAGVELYHKLVIAMLIARLGETRAATPIPVSVAAQYDVEFRRILAQFNTNPDGFYVLGNDLFNKDLAICRGKLIPCGAELVDTFSGVPRRIASCGGLNNWVRFSRFSTAGPGVSGHFTNCIWIPGLVASSLPKAGTAVSSESRICLR